MRNTNHLTNQIHRMVDLNSLQMHPHTLIGEPQNQPPINTRDESVGAKWEQIQCYEAKENHSLNSIASSTGSGTHSTTSSSASSTTPSQNEKIKSRLAKFRQSGLKKLASFKLWPTKDRGSNPDPQKSEQLQQVPPVSDEVNHAPNGHAHNGLTISKLRASKSMQNLEQLTRDSLYNLKDISNNIKQKYNSRMELRHQNQMYNELWDDEEEENQPMDFYHHRTYDY